MRFAFLIGAGSWTSRRQEHALIGKSLPEVAAVKTRRKEALAIPAEDLFFHQYLLFGPDLKVLEKGICSARVLGTMFRSHSTIGKNPLPFPTHLKTSIFIIS